MKKRLLDLIFDSLLVISNIYSQGKIKITGKISSSENAPITGATVQEEGTQNQTVANENGTFSINVYNANATLLFSSIGLETRKVKLNGLTHINVQLESKSGQLGEVVVIGYGTVKKSDITGSISSVKASDLKEMPTQRVDQALQGRAAGVVVQNTDAAPGGNTRIRVRGTNS